ncbi:hypothetical protein [Kitasatospora sp. NPDC058046]|uniref:hypothetical protein n=1 Tax=Kitasatospora sp. NPDC058046 TaxID=3346312 RepID=UPI0036DED20B
MKVTDQITVGGEQAGRLMARVAMVLRRVYPSLPLQAGPEGPVFGVLFSESYAEAATDAEAEQLAQQTLGLLPEISAKTSRGEYALLLFKAAYAAGYDWETGDTRPITPIDSAPQAGLKEDWARDVRTPAIPKIPGQRTASPVPAPQGAAAGPRGPKDPSAPGGPRGPRLEVAV